MGRAIDYRGAIAPPNDHFLIEVRSAWIRDVSLHPDAPALDVGGRLNRNENLNEYVIYNN